jgi:ligand-binding SRPBCC domain-containing protein
MTEIKLVTHFRAPAERVFDLSLSIDLHQRSTGKTGERAVAGRTSGLIGLGETVTWRARHLGVWQHLTTRISAYDRPRHFADEQVRGAFAWFRHDHWFEPDGEGGCVVRESFRFAAPLGPLGWIAERVFLRRYMTRFLRERNEVIRQVAESDEWRKYLLG